MRRLLPLACTTRQGSLTPRPAIIAVDEEMGSPGNPCRYILSAKPDTPIQVGLRVNPDIQTNPTIIQDMGVLLVAEVRNVTKDTVEFTLISEREPRAYAILTARYVWAWVSWKEKLFRFFLRASYPNSMIDSLAHRPRYCFNRRPKLQLPFHILPTPAPAVHIPLERAQRREYPPSQRSKCGRPTLDD
ncbi:hypothetical protein PHLCEN_2v4024 [Hermanssonia centrifuga]|uniref:Uncharacterized protein n=1 Tax=Hermanssonia centrifuga TaxID=98765 RepID=A0A1U7K3D3_9APHY|nr:hypothetical protein PHLCEN_2v4024 [Hermanssonia centrifuga]